MYKQFKDKSANMLVVILSIALVFMSVSFVLVPTVLADGSLYVTAVNAENAESNKSSSVAETTLAAPSTPSVVTVGVPANGIYTLGSTLYFTVDFDQNVIVDTTDGTPSLSLMIGTKTVNAQYVSGTGTSTLTFSYTVQGGDSDPNGIAVGSGISLNGGRITDSESNIVPSVTLNNVGSTTGVLVSAVALDTLLTSTPALITNGKNDTFGFSSNNNRTSYECSLDGSLFSSCSNPFTLNGLADGSHTFQVRAVDGPDDKDLTPASYIWTVDTVIPDTTIESGPPAASYGTSATFEFSSTKNNSGFECSLDGAAFGNCAANETFSNLAEGNHTLLVRAVDAAGNVDPTPASYTWNNYEMKLTFLNSTYTVVKGSFVPTVVSITSSDGSHLDVTKDAIFAISDSAIASIDANGLVKGLSVGQTVITATYVGKTAQATINVTNDMLSIAFSKKEYMVTKNSSVPTVLSATYSDGSQLDVTRDAQFTVANPAIATIDANGRVTGLSVGRTAVTATYNTGTASAFLVVTQENESSNPGSGGGNSTPPVTPAPPVTSTVTPVTPVTPPDKDKPTDENLEDVTGVSFSDISGHWAEDSIKKAVSAGIVKGYPDGMFKPDNAVTRAEFVVMLMNALKMQEAGAELNFSDAAEIRAWAQKAVSQALLLGIVNGYEDGTFGPNGSITRAEIAMMIAKILKLPNEGNAITPFTDDKEIPVWAKGAVEALKGKGIIQGTGTNQFNPRAHTTRAEALTVLLNMLDRLN
ncbi:S-layer homology domain-containing protein [Paenibacillus sp. AR247]|uniref:S-layer homology domain-containing protein n=1 Tax=Paenibacillus sp. AR247 TaxID=1631599 RepID=UPI000CF9592A|nr:S-layer homology domain-containing protein [Paenibacillus sp. AR247]PQP85535.1 hypothetical protein CPT76_35810 [Paenibacillus sp. AR247]